MMPLAALLWLVLLQLVSAPSLHRERARQVLGMPAATWGGSQPTSLQRRPRAPASTPSLLDAESVRVGAALPARTIAVPRPVVRVALRSTGGLRADPAPAPSSLAGDHVLGLASRELSRRLVSHAVEAHGGRLPYLPTAPPLHG